MSIRCEHYDAAWAENTSVQLARLGLQYECENIYSTWCGDEY